MEKDPMNGLKKIIKKLTILLQLKFMSFKNWGKSCYR